MLNLILFGPPGAGKGTQAVNLAQKFNLAHLSTGDILRGEVENGTDLGRRAKAIMDAGELVSDDIVVGMIENKIKAVAHKCNGFIFDGFPRTVAQAVALDQMLAELGMEITVVLKMEVPEDELVTRLLKRGQEQGRTDDNEETIRKRFQNYLQQTMPVASHYAAQGKLREVPGVGAVSDIQQRLEAQIPLPA